MKPAKERLVKAEFAVNLFHAQTLQSLDVWTSGPKETVVSRCLFILGVRANANAVMDKEQGVIRQYDLGLAPRVKDTRTGRVTTRVKDVLKGRLEIQFAP